MPSPNNAEQLPAAGVKRAPDIIKTAQTTGGSATGSSNPIGQSNYRDNGEQNSGIYRMQELLILLGYYSDSGYIPTGYFSISYHPRLDHNDWSPMTVNDTNKIKQIINADKLNDDGYWKERSNWPYFVARSGIIFFDG